MNFRPSVESLESRENPATLGDIPAISAMVEHNAGVMSYMVEHPGYASNTDLQPLGLTVATVVSQQSHSDVLALNELLVNLQSQVATDPTLAATLQPIIVQTTDLAIQAGNNLITAQVFANYIITVNPKLAPPPPPVANFGTGTGTENGTNPDGTPSNSSGLVDSKTLFNADGTVNQDAVTKSLQNNGNMPSS